MINQKAHTSIRLRASLTPKLTKYIPHQPTSKQAAFLLIPHREAFYGGSAGGGKSDALLMAALQYVDVPGYAALLLRRSYADLTLPGSLMERAEQWLKGTDARWIDKEKTWIFPSGARLTFGYLSKENDKYRYKSAEFQFVGFDELTQFSETMYLYLLTRLRRKKGAKVPIRLRSASNPGDIGHEWVRNRFVDYKASVLPGTKSEEIFRSVRPFVRAKLTDNPHLDADEYSENFKEVDLITREQLLNGDWSIRKPGSKFLKENFCRIVRLNEVPVGLHWIRYWDMAATEPKQNSKNKDPDWTAGALIAYERATGDWYCKDVRRERKAPAEIEAFIRQTAEEDGPHVRIYMEQEPGASGKTVCDHYRRNILIGYNFRGMRSTGSKEVRATIFAIAVGNQRFVMVQGPYISILVDECEAFPNPGWHDDQVDAVSGAMQKLRNKKQIKSLGRNVATLQEEIQRDEVRRSLVLV